jgi:phosphatidylserine/phosphatidylglycerophosphate/cardiolipin synthase-like enzyme
VDETTGNVKLSLTHLKSWLQRKKAWEANRKAFTMLAGKIVPVIHLQQGRPRDKRFSGSDTLLGTFLVTEEDENVLSCLLCPRPWKDIADNTGLDERMINRFSHGFLSGEKDSKKRRRELPIYSPNGGLMGPANIFASNGTACKDVWITQIQTAKLNIRINAFCISDPDIIEELRKAAAPARGVEVRIRYDARQQIKTQQGIFEDERMRYVLAHPVEISAEERVIMHKKELLVDFDPEVHGHDQDGRSTRLDSCSLVMGSYNPTLNAKGSQESVIVITDVDVVKACAERFDHDWEQEARNLARETSVSFSPVWSRK